MSSSRAPPAWLGIPEEQVMDQQAGDGEHGPYGYRDGDSNDGGAGLDGSAYADKASSGVNLDEELPQVEHGDDAPQKRSGCALNLALSVFLIPVAILLFKYLNDIVQFIVDHVYWMLVFGFIFKLVSKIIFALAFVPIGTLYKLVHALLPGDGDCVRDHDYGNATLAVQVSDDESSKCDDSALANACFISPAMGALLYSSLSAIIEAAAFVFHRRFTQMNDDGEEAAAIIVKLREGLSKVIALQSEMTDPKKFLEIYCVQNAFGVPDTGTLIYYACATDYPAKVFIGATTLSYLTIGMVKQTAWIVALRTVATRLKCEGFDAVIGISRDLDDFTKYTLTLIGVMGAIAICYKVVTIVQGFVKDRNKQPLDPDMAEGKHGRQTLPPPPPPAPARLSRGDDGTYTSSSRSSYHDSTVTDDNRQSMVTDNPLMPDNLQQSFDDLRRSRTAAGDRVPGVPNVRVTRSDLV